MNILRFLLILTGFTLSAETIRFRSGTLLSAELSTTPPKMVSIDPVFFPKLPKNKIYGVIVFKLDPLRQITIYDYSLRSFDQNFPCVGIWKNNHFQFNDTEIDGVGIHALLFVLDGSLVGLKNTEILEIVANCPPGNIARQEVIFNVVPRLHAPNQVPRQGLMRIKL